MTAMLALRGSNEDRADCYGLLAADLWDWDVGTDWSYSIDPFDYTLPRNKQTSALHLLITAKEGAAADHILYEVIYDTDDLQGTYRVPGHPTVVGVWVTSYTLTGTVCEPPGDPGLRNADRIAAYLPDPTLYVITEAAGDAAYMFQRGVNKPPR